MILAKVRHFLSRRTRNQAAIVQPSKKAQAVLGTRAYGADNCSHVNASAKQ